ncbi:DUF2793 domain-containing protein [Pelagimonas varians]|uniref:DUF2793 domain-containing protein n=1 Tax=Pelagimonas varians TaxID=696760 RepID=A0A238K003_9RHOB|nr:DUF2793 domain-containing protein [Pelagimonas varians]PYG33136.1 uncharacterized protein DUF2793 [Pelagimonas varians]SMX35787.1 hypothetical protein PEV8663_00593 [Pelagimonas varians]
MGKTMFSNAYDGGGSLSVGKKIGRGNVAAAQVERLARQAAASGAVLLIDEDITLAGDVVIDRPVHLKIPVGVTVSMADNPSWTRGVALADRSTYYSGMFTFRPGSEGSVVEIWGVLDGNLENAGLVDTAPVGVGGVLAVGHGYDLGYPALNFIGRPRFENVAAPGILIGTSFWGPGEWKGAEFMAPSLPVTFHRVIDRDLTAPPLETNERDAYIVATGATGEWAGWDGDIAYRWEGAWQRRTPVFSAGEYWEVIVEDEALRAMWDGSAWVDQYTRPGWDDPDLLEPE